MTVRVNKSSFNIREKLSELGRKFGLKGSELVAAETVQEARDVVSAGRKNLVINGDQRIDQRNNGSAVATSSSFPVDRFTISHSSNGAFSAQRSTEAPIGFQYSTKFTTTTADTSLTGSQRCLYFTKIEGQNAQHLEFGTTNAKPVTLSFWVRSSVTGTFSGSLQNGAQNRSYPYDYTINAADTWEYKTITIPGDVTGTWATDNTKSHQIFWSLGISSSYAAPVNAWVAAQRWGSTTGTAGIMGTLNATWYITGVQLEAGRNATDFEYRSIGEELALCQRYYQKMYYTNSDYPFGYCYTYQQAASACSVPLAAPMRTSSPNINYSTLRIRGYNQDGTNGSQAITSASGQTQESHALLQLNLGHTNVPSAAVGSGSVLTNGLSNSSSYLEVDAEL